MIVDTRIIRFAIALVVICVTGVSSVLTTGGRANARPSGPPKPLRCPPGYHPTEGECVLNPFKAVFTWRLPNRLVDRGDGVPIESLDTSRTDNLYLDGCSSSSGKLHTRLTRFDWTIATGPQVRHMTAGCAVSLQRPLTGAWTTWMVTLTITRSDKAQTSTTNAVTFRDLVIASLGDSAASGEGAPEKYGLYHWRVTTNGAKVTKEVVSALWATDGGSRCDRSGRAGSAQAALRIEKVDPRTSVTFWHLACSGAAITGPYGQGGLLETYDGENPPSGHICPRLPAPARLRSSVQGCHVPLPAQLTELSRLITAAGRRPDALLIAAGANDVNWSQVVKDCYNLRYDVPFHHKCSTQHRQKVERGLALLPGRFKLLSQRLTDMHIAPSSVFLTDYWDPTVDDRGGRFNGHGFSWFCEKDLFAPKAGERKWGHYSIVVPMNREVSDAARRYGWQWIGGIADAFQRHGLCSTPANSWIVSPEDSLTHQGTANGSWHANEAGQQAITNRILISLSSVLGI